MPPVKKLPSLKDVLEVPRTAPAAAPATEPESGPESEQSPEPAPDATAPETAEQPAQVPVDVTPEDFETCWRSLFEEIFASDPMIYHPLKDKIPTLEDGVMKIEVLNEFQKEHYEMRKRALLEYWRNHFSINVDDVEITVNEHLEMKKIIYSAEDKMNNLAEENPAFRDFLMELNFRIKD